MTAAITTSPKRAAQEHSEAWLPHPAEEPGPWVFVARHGRCSRLYNAQRIPWDRRVKMLLLLAVRNPPSRRS